MAMLKPMTVREPSLSVALPPKVAASAPAAPMMPKAPAQALPKCHGPLASSDARLTQNALKHAHNSAWISIASRSGRWSRASGHSDASSPR